MKHAHLPGFVAAAIVIGLPYSLPEGSYERTDLLSDGAITTPNLDPNLVNAWGLASSPSGPFWIANEGTGSSAIVLADGSAFAPDVAVPADKSGHPTGLVFNGTQGFVVAQGGTAGPSLFLFVTLEGRILGWNPSVDPANAIVAVDNGAQHAVYTGAALAMVGTEPRLYAANFAARRVEVFDAGFVSVAAFADAGVPSRYSPFNIASVGGRLLVAYVPRDATTGDEVPGPGNGLIDVFSTDGTLLHRLVTGGELNAPWGMVWAPPEFGTFGDTLLVGNFGDGRILSYSGDGTFLGQLEDDEGEPIVIDGLWGLLFGNGGSGGDPEDLYFTAGILDEEHGLFGEIEFEE